MLQFSKSNIALALEYAFKIIQDDFKKQKQHDSLEFKKPAEAET